MGFDFAQADDFASSGNSIVRSTPFAPYVPIVWDGLDICWGEYALAWGLEPRITASRPLTSAGLSFTRQTALT